MSLKTATRLALGGVITAFALFILGQLMAFRHFNIGLIWQLAQTVYTISLLLFLGVFYVRQR